MTKKLIMFDIDGTLLDHEKQLPESTKQAIKELKEAGHEVAIATGRAPYFIKDIRKELEIDSFVCFNGQYVESDNEVIYTNPINREYLHLLSTHSSTNDHPLIFMGAESMKSTVDKHADIDESLTPSPSISRCLKWMRITITITKSIKPCSIAGRMQNLSIEKICRI